jgi:hypothetical protein
MSFDFDAGELNLDDIQSKALSDEQMEQLNKAIQDDLSTAKTVGQVLNILTKASLLAMKFGVLV